MAAANASLGDLRTWTHHVARCSSMDVYKLSRRTEYPCSVGSSSAVCRRLASYRFCPHSPQVCATAVALLHLQRQRQRGILQRIQLDGICSRFRTALALTTSSLRSVILNSVPSSENTDQSKLFRDMMGYLSWELYEIHNYTTWAQRWACRS